MSPFSSGYWRAYNVLRRFVGLWFAVLGTAMALEGVWWALRPESFPAEPATSLAERLAVAAAGAVAAAIGVAVLRAPSFRPDLGDVLWIAAPQEWRAQRAHRRERAWWTGDPRPAEAPTPGAPAA